MIVCKASILVLVGKELKKQKRLYTVLPLTINPTYQVKVNTTETWLLVGN